MTPAGNNVHLHPVFATILKGMEQVPVQVRRAGYVSRLMKMDWEFEFAPRIQRNQGAEELKALYELQTELDPTAELWNRYAKPGYLITRSVKVSATKGDGGYVCDYLKSNLHNVDLVHNFLEKHDLPATTRVEVEPIVSHTASDIERGPIT